MRRASSPSSIWRARPGSCRSSGASNPTHSTFRTPGIGIGTQAPVTRNELVHGLPPATEVFYRAVTENASGTARGAVRSFTTQSPPPTISDLRLIDVGDDSATLRFTIDPGGANAAYRVRIDGDDPPLTPLPGTGPREITRTLSGLTPDADHQLQVVVTGPGGQTDGLISVRTLRRISGTAGVALTVGQECPANAQVSWGDGSSTPATCSTGSMTANHTYAAGGRYRVEFAYDDGSRDEIVAAVAPTAGRRVLSVNVTGRGRVTGNGIDCPGVCSVELPLNAPAALTAAPHSGAQFHGWGDACTGTRHLPAGAVREPERRGQLQRQRGAAVSRRAVRRDTHGHDRPAPVHRLGRRRAGDVHGRGRRHRARAGVHRFRHGFAGADAAHWRASSPGGGTQRRSS